MANTGKIAVKPAASARSPRAIFTKTGTTGAKGAAASKSIPAAYSGGRAKARARP